MTALDRLGRGLTLLVGIGLLYIAAHAASFALGAGGVLAFAFAAAFVALGLAMVRSGKRGAW